MTLRAPIVALTFLSAVATGSACVKPVSESLRPCPCASDLICCPATNSCIAAGEVCPATPQDSGTPVVHDDAAEPQRADRIGPIEGGTPDIGNPPSGECHSQDDCDPSETCYFYDQGCSAAGRCEARSSCLPDGALSSDGSSLDDVCGCRSVTLSACVTEPWVHRGPCVPDGGQIDPPDTGVVDPADIGVIEDGAIVPLPNDSGPDAAGGCLSQSDCSPNETCYFYTGGCAPGRCEPQNACMPDIGFRPDGGFNEFCSCNGQTVRACVTEPWEYEGPCLPGVGDAGVRRD